MSRYRIPGPLGIYGEIIKDGTLCLGATATPGPVGTPKLDRINNIVHATGSSHQIEHWSKQLKETVDTPIKSGKYWVTWAETNATQSTALNDLEVGFKSNVDSFLKALTNAGIKFTVSTTKRSPLRAYLFHWSWKIALGKCKTSEPSKVAGVNIDWDHGDDQKSKLAAQEMVDGFGLAVPPKSTVAPALTSNHILGKAIDITFEKWVGTIKIKKKDNVEVAVEYKSDVNANKLLHEVGASYGLIKHVHDAPHWSFNGR